MPLLKGVRAVAKVFAGTGTSEKFAPPGCVAGAELGSALAQVAGTLVGAVVFVGIGMLVAVLAEPLLVAVEEPPPRLHAASTSKTQPQNKADRKNRMALLNS